MIELTYDKDNFYLNGEPFVILSGAMHYFRIPREYWHDRLLKLKECGFNTVETYTCWNLHEPCEGEFNFSGILDVGAFIEEAEKLGLYVMIRPGPYICAEWDFGGLPSWILKYEKMTIRCYNEEFLSKIRRYYKELFAHIRPHLSSNGGNVIMLQVENEYGSYGDDHRYMAEIANIYRENGMDCLYFTADGTTHTMLNAGSLPGVLSVANFGSKPRLRLGELKAYHKNQPSMCGEFYCGWFDHWFEDHHIRTNDGFIDEINTFLDMNASFNIYMFHGGTNFGFWNGANYAEFYQPTITSYDYNSPLNESGDRTPMYYKLRETLEKRFGRLPPITAKDSEKKAYGKLKLTQQADLFDNIDNISSPVFSPMPQYMEDVDQDYGYILYRSEMDGPRSELTMNIDTVHDRAQVFIDGSYKGVYERWHKSTEEEKVICPAVDFNDSITFDILVENMGRVNYGGKLMDHKGIHGVRFERTFHFGWKMYPLPMNNLEKLVYEKKDTLPKNSPTFFKGNLEITEAPCDTFLRLDGFTKGFVTVNGFNIGRYFNPAGPQKTLYVPAPFLRTGENEIVVFESDSTDRLEVEFFAEPDLGPVQIYNK